MARIAVSLVMVMVISASLWFASPVSALTVNITNPDSGTLGGSYSFSTTITIEDPERLPITDITMYIYKGDARASYQATLSALPLGDETKSYNQSQTGDAGTATVTADATSGWLSGYGYRSATFDGNSNYWGYGYGYGGLSSITYSVNWNSPSNWPVGTYRIETKITANGTQFTMTSSSISMSATSSGGGGGLPGQSGVASTSLFGSQGTVKIDKTTGAIQSAVSATSADGKLKMSIKAGTKALTQAGLPVSSLRVNTVTPPSPPKGKNVIGLAYDFGPNGATFDPGIELVFTYDPADLPDRVNEADLVIAYFDETTREWVTLHCTVDTVTKTITAQVSHFTTFTILATPSPIVPATFIVSDLTVSPATVNIRETVTINATLSNTGETEGSYYVTLAVNGAPIATKELSLAGNTSQLISFTTSGSTAGTYSVDVNGETGQFTVNAAPATTEPTTPSVTEPTVTINQPTTPTDTTPPVVPSTNWWLIGGIIIGMAVILGLLLWYFLRQE
jgi:hypothetical protein